MQCVWWFCSSLSSIENTLGMGRFCAAAFAIFVVVGRVFVRMPYLVIAGAAAAPVLLLIVDHPYSAMLQSVDPRAVMAAGWAVMLLLMVALRLICAACAMLNPFTPAATPWIAGLAVCCALLLVSIAIDPQLLNLLSPQARSVLGITAAAGAAVLTGASCIRCARFAIPLVFWGAMLASLSGYMVYQKTPVELWKMPRQELIALLPGGQVPQQRTPER